jgi:hypothetical protein
MLCTAWIKILMIFKDDVLRLAREEVRESLDQRKELIEARRR